MCEFTFIRYGMFWIYVVWISVSEFCLKSAQNTPFIKILHSVTHKCPVFENFLPLCDPLKPPPCLSPLLPISCTLYLCLYLYTLYHFLSYTHIYHYCTTFSFMALYTSTLYHYTTFSFMSYHKPRIPNIQVSNSKSQQTKTGT